MNTAFTACLLPAAVQDIYVDNSFVLSATNLKCLTKGTRHFHGVCVCLSHDVLYSLSQSEK